VPQIPTMAESGLAGFDVSPWFGLFYPDKTLGSIAGRLHADARKVLSAADLKAKIADQGAEVALSESPGQFAAYVSADNLRWSNVVREGVPLNQ
jgi:tripartite-type tricarboxylate transporter receptor subunit TctC